MHIKLPSVKAIVPILGLILISLLLSIPNSFLAYGKCTPAYDLIIIFYCTLLLPQTMSSGKLFLLGIINDAILGYNLGTSPVIFLAFFLFVEFYKNFLINKSFIMIWTGFAICSLYAFLIKAAILYIFYHFQFEDLYIFFISWYISIIIYPLAHFVLDITSNLFRLNQN